MRNHTSSFIKDISPRNRNTMVSLMTNMCLVAALCGSLCGAAPVSQSFAVAVRSPVSVHLGHTTTLPCWLDPPQSAENLEVRWYRGDRFDSPVMLYQAKKYEHASQDASYTGRVSFGSKDAAFGELRAGDVSLQLANTTLEDVGDYTCYVSSEHGYDSATARLIVTETGTPLFLSVAWTENNMANVSCESEGWYPEPSLRWSNQKQILRPKSLEYSKDSSGLLSVHSWLLVTSSSEVSCSVGLSGEEAKEARVQLDNPPQAESGSSVIGWVAFAILFIVMLAVFGLLYFKMKRGVKKAASETEHDGETQELLSKDMILPTALSTAKQHYVNVTLETSENEYLIIKDNLLRDANCDFPDGPDVTCLTAIKGTPGFSSGQHYWEVSLGNTTTEPKQSWWIGVTSVTSISAGTNFTPAASNGYWFLSSSPKRAGHLQFSTKPKVLLPVSSTPHTVGVYLNYDSGELSFYNVEQNCLIGSVTATFKDKVFPLFNPGKGDQAPMKILQDMTKQVQSTDMGNNVDKA